ncbi:MULTISPECIES: hypothetical protein [unclassified Campylobacter]|uniref:hypothetical protein n=1 Tax=unclassified Campylobacter TaxID=2593542 RepID=UPI0022E9D47B|nr:MULTISPECIES: hypothetical protein [unclassified Campylobacter]MDA3062704.1 hypothetical protein [Campylobacter sp. JMF_14 EL1]MDA3073995.1 hypothetical protein [Campylobacter sp. JMF_10 EL2]
MEKTEQFIKELGEFIKKSDSITDPIYPRFEKLIEILDKEQPQKGKNKEVVNLSIFDPLAKFYDIDEAKNEVFTAFYTFLKEFLAQPQKPTLSIHRLKLFDEAIDNLRLVFKNELDIRYNRAQPKYTTIDGVKIWDLFDFFDNEKPKHNLTDEQTIKIKDELIRQGRDIENIIFDFEKSFNNFCGLAVRFLTHDRVEIKKYEKLTDKQGIKNDFNKKILDFCKVYKVEATDPLKRGEFTADIERILKMIEI